MFGLQVDGALRELQNSVEMLMNLYSQQQRFHKDVGARGDQSTLTQVQPTTPLFLYSLTQAQFHEAESTFLQELTGYTKKHFYPVSVIQGCDRICGSLLLALL